MTKSPTAAFLTTAIETSGLTQREIAQRAGFPKPNVLSMMKTGETKVPIERIPALAEACGADEIEFARIAMLEYHPDLWGTLNLMFDLKLTDRDIAVLRTLRQADPEGEILWMKQDLQMLAYMFKYMLNWMQHTSELASTSGKAALPPDREVLGGGGAPWRLSRCAASRKRPIPGVAAIVKKDGNQPVALCSSDALQNLRS